MPDKTYETKYMSLTISSQETITSLIDIGWCRIMEDSSYYTPSDFEYICKKAIGFDGTISVHAPLQMLAKRPDAEEILTTIAKYRKMQEENKFSEDEKEHFRRSE